MSIDTAEVRTDVMSDEEVTITHLLLNNIRELSDGAIKNVVADNNQRICAGTEGRE